MLKGYTLPQIGLHWGIALLLGLQFLFNEPMGEAYDQVRDGIVPPSSIAVWAHIAVGVVILLLVVWRLSLRLTLGAPPVEGGPEILHKAAEAGHWALYGLMVLLPLSGLAAWFGGISLAGEAHGLMTNILLFVAGVHVVAALYHQFWLKDGLLWRMMRPER